MEDGKKSTWLKRFDSIRSFADIFQVPKIGGEEIVLRNFLFILTTFYIPSVFAQSFVTDRFPVGDPERKYGFCAVKIGQLYDLS